MSTRRYRYNRAVDAHNKGDEFEASPDDRTVQSLLGAGYAEPVLELVPVEELDPTDEPEFVDGEDQWSST